MLRSRKHVFFPEILERGKKYFEEGKVGNIRHASNSFLATVKGTKDYEVEIFTDGEYVKKMTCTCPYALRGDCKHMAAVLFALESKNILVEELPPVNQPPIVAHIPMEIPWVKAVDNLPEDVVRKELLRRADRDDCLKERLTVLYLGKLPDNQIHNWRADFQEMAAKYTDYMGRIDEDDTWDFLNYLSNFLNEKLPLLYEVGAFEDIFGLVCIVMETALEWQFDDADAQLPELFQECEDALIKLMPAVTADFKKQMLQWYRDNRNEKWPGGVEYMDRVFGNLENLPQDVGAN